MQPLWYSSDLTVGYSYTDTHCIEPRMTVPQLYPEVDFCSQMPHVLATGYMVGIMELVCTRSVMPFVDWPRIQSVGVLVNFDHLAASTPGMVLRVDTMVTGLSGRRIQFAVKAWDGIDLVCQGAHERMFIDSQVFNTRLANKVARHGT